MAACALGTHVDENGVWCNGSTIIRELGHNRVSRYLPSVPRAAMHRRKRNDENDDAYYDGKPNAASFRPGRILRRDHRGPANRLDRACHAKKNQTTIPTWVWLLVIGVTRLT